MSHLPPSSTSSAIRLQLIAPLLLACFAAQCLVIAWRAPLLPEEIAIASPGPLGATRQFAKPPDPYHSPLVYRIAQLPVRRGTVPWFDFIGPRYQHRFLLRLAFVVFGVLLGVSIWYVARRLYGNAGAAFALALYCFSPRMVAEGSHIRPDVLASWGFFGVIFLSIASAHTLYAAPETLGPQARWRRAVLMGIALGVAVGAQFSTWIALPLAAGFLLYLAPGRRRAALAMVAAAVAIAAVVFFAAYGFDWQWMRAEVIQAITDAPPNAASSRFEALAATLRQTNPAFLAMLAAGIATWLAWHRARWFGNTAALIAVVAVPLCVPVFPGPEPFRLWIPGVALLFMFTGGVFADLVETRRRKLALGCALVLLLADIGYALVRAIGPMSS